MFEHRVCAACPYKDLTLWPRAAITPSSMEVDTIKAIEDTLNCVQGPQNKIFAAALFVVASAY